MHIGAVQSARALKKILFLEKIARERGLTGLEERVDLTGTGEYDIVQTVWNGSLRLSWTFEIEQRGPSDMTAKVRVLLGFGKTRDCPSVGVCYDAETDEWMTDHRRLEASDAAFEMARMLGSGFLAEPLAIESVQMMISVFQKHLPEAP